MKIFATLLLLATLLSSCDRGPASGPPAASPTTPVTIVAASSLTELVTEVASAWSRASGRPVRLQFGSSSTLARQIAAGAPADVFVSADPEWMDTVTPSARFDWLGNRLVCVVPVDAPDAPPPPTVAADLARLPALALGGESVPAGRYARAALESLGVRAPDRVVSGSSVRDVLEKVALGAAPAGIVYATDAAVEPRVRVAFVFPDDSHPPIRYVVGLLAPAGKEVFEAMRAAEALAAARRRGFTTP